MSECYIVQTCSLACQVYAVCLLDVTHCAVLWRENRVRPSALSCSTNHSFQEVVDAWFLVWSLAQHPSFLKVFHGISMKLPGAIGMIRIKE